MGPTQSGLAPRDFAPAIAFCFLVRLGRGLSEGVRNLGCRVANFAFMLSLLLYYDRTMVAASSIFD